MNPLDGGEPRYVSLRRSLPTGRRIRGSAIRVEPKRRPAWAHFTVGLATM